MSWVSVWSCSTWRRQTLADRLYGRRAAIEVDGRRYRMSDFDLEFAVKNTNEVSKNTADVVIWNLSETTRNAIKKGQNLAIEAGYQSRVGWIFSGDIVQPSSVMVPGEGWRTTIQAGDGHKGLKNLMNVSVAPGAKVGDLLQAMGRAGGFDLTRLNQALENGDLVAAFQEFKNGYTMTEEVGAELKRLSDTINADVSIQQGQLIVQNTNEADRDLAVILSPETGMVGGPERVFDENQPGRVITKTTCLLNARIVPGRVVVQKSKSLSGNFKVTRADHRGGSKLDEFYTTFEGFEIQGTVRAT